jgi:hypothetical protein
MVLNITQNEYLYFIPLENEKFQNTGDYLINFESLLFAYLIMIIHEVKKKIMKLYVPAFEKLSLISQSD